MHTFPSAEFADEIARVQHMSNAEFKDFRARVQQFAEDAILARSHARSSQADVDATRKGIAAALKAIRSDR